MASPVQNEAADIFKPGEILVRFAAKTSATTMQPTFEQYNVTPIRALYRSDVQLMRVPTGREIEIAAALSADPRVRYAEPNYRYHAFDTTPDDPQFSHQWAHPMMRSPSAWDISTGSAAVVIAIVDSGVDLSHPDLAGKLVAGHDFVDDDSTPNDANGHGTHVAGIAAAITNNATGVAGTSWGAKIMPVRVLDNAGYGYNADITDGIIWAYQHGADVINLSLGGTAYSQAMQDAVNAAHAAGSLVVAAMGNCRTTGPGCPTANPTAYPAAYANVFAVAATTASDTYAPYSQYGAHCDIAAPGGAMNYYHDANGIYSTMPTYAVYLTTHYSYYNNYDTLQGTSQAAPHVSGLAALIWSVDPTLTNDAVQNVIQQTADDLGPAGKDQNYGWGRIDSYAALASLIVPDAPVLAPIDNADGDAAYTVAWSAVADVTGYLLQESGAANFNAPIPRYSGPNTQRFIAGQNVGTWYYRVQATNAYGNKSVWSNVQSVDVLPAAPTAAPIVNPTDADAYTVTWATVSGADRYVLQQDTTSTFTAPVTRYLGTDRTYAVTGQPGGTWYYRARATHANLLGPWSASVTTTVAPAPLSPPTLTVLSDDGDGDYALDWSDVVSATVYTLEESISPYFTNPLVVYNGATSAYTVTGQDGGRRHYRVRAAGPDGRSPWSESRAVAVLAYVYLPQVLRDYTPPVTVVPVPNGDFESGPVTWTVHSAVGRSVITDTFTGGVTPHGGRWAAWLGGGNNESASIQQRITVTTEAPYLVYWYWIDSSDTCGYDDAAILIDNTAVQTYALCAATKTSGWTEAVLDLRAHAGISVSLTISATTDFTLISNFFVDDVILRSTP